MDLVTYNANIYFFLILSLLVWFLQAVYSLQLWFFFFFTELLTNFKYFYFFKNYPRAGFLIIYATFIYFTTLLVNTFQFVLFFFILSLKKTNNRYLETASGRGMIVKGFEVVSLYLPIKVTTPGSGFLLVLQALVKAVSLVLVFVFFNSLV